MGFTKLDEGIVLSSVWSEPCEIRVVWITLMAMADQHGVVHSSLPGLARSANVPLEVIVTALEKFKAPDAYSRTKDNDGRRIEEVAGGWLLLNYAKYRRWSYSDSPDAVKKRQQRGTHGDMSPNVPTSRGHSASVSVSVSIPSSLSSSSLFLSSWDEWKQHRKELKKKMTSTGESKLLAKLEAMGPEKAIAAINHSISNGWTGVFEPQQQAPRREYNGPEKGSPPPAPAVRHEEYRAKKIAPEERADQGFLSDLVGGVMAKIAKG